MPTEDWIYLSPDALVEAITNSDRRPIGQPAIPTDFLRKRLQDLTDAGKITPESSQAALKHLEDISTRPKSKVKKSK